MMKEASDPGEFGAGHDIGPGGRYWRVRADMWRAGFTNLVARLSPLVPPVEFPEGTGDVDAFTVAQQIASKFEAVVEEYRNLCQQSGDLLDAVHDGIAANLAFREKGGALPDEDMPTFCDRLIAERDREKLNAEKWFDEYEAASSELTVALDKCAEHVREIDALRGEREALKVRVSAVERNSDGLHLALTTICYLDRNGCWCIGRHGDSDVSDEVAGALANHEALASEYSYGSTPPDEALRARLSESPLRGEGQVTIEAVATVVSEGGELWLDWLLEGGIGAILPGELLCITSATIPDNGLLTIASPHPAEANTTGAQGGDALDAKRYRWLRDEGHVTDARIDSAIEADRPAVESLRAQIKAMCAALSTTTPARGDKDTSP